LFGGMGGVLAPSAPGLAAAANMAAYTSAAQAMSAATNPAAGMSSMAGYDYDVAGTRAPNAGNPYQQAGAGLNQFYSQFDVGMAPSKPVPLPPAQRPPSEKAPPPIPLPSAQLIDSDRTRPRRPRDWAD
jgi:hypothetical protein